MLQMNHNATVYGIVQQCCVAMGRRCFKGW